MAWRNGGAKSSLNKPVPSKTSSTRSVYDQSSWLQKCLYLYLWPLVVKSRKWRDLLRGQEFDNYSPAELSPSQAGELLEQNWHLEQKKHGPHLASLTRTVARTFGRQLLGITLLQLLGDLVFEPLYYYLAIQLIDIISQFQALNFALQESQSLNSTVASLAQLNGTTTSAAAAAAADYHDLALNRAQLKTSLISYAFLFLVAIFGASILTHPFNWRANKLALRLRVALSRMVYKKSLVIDKFQPRRAPTKDQPGDDKVVGTGNGQLNGSKPSKGSKDDEDARVSGVSYKQAISLISRDVEQFELNLVQLAWVLTGPMQCIILTAILTRSLDVQTALIALVLNGLVAVQRGYMNIELRKHSRSASAVADKRISLVSEALEAIRIIRMYAWTRPVEEKIAREREREMDQHKRRVFVICLDNALFHITCSGSAILTLLYGHYVRGLPMSQANISQVFMVVGVYRRTLSRYLPQGILSWIHVLIVLSRCGKYLRAAERRSQHTTSHQQQEAQQQQVAVESMTEKKPSLSVRRLSLEWPSLDSRPPRRPCFSGLSFEAMPGELVLVAGRVGSGKSALLQTLLGELSPTSGRIQLQCSAAEAAAGKRNRLAYAPQEAWIFSGSVRDNILLGELLDLKRYIQVLRCCCLLPDLLAFGQFDRTQIGERGVTLSGGQRARVNLARAIYQSADLYLLDDPLSAVDAHVARHIFQRALKEFLADRTVLLVTHQVQFLRQADKVLHLRATGSAGSSLGSFGTFEELERLGSLRGVFQGSGEQTNECETTTEANETFNRLGQSKDHLSDDYIERRVLSDVYDDEEQEEMQTSAACRRNELAEVVSNQAKRNASSVAKATLFYLKACGLLNWLIFLPAVFTARFFFIGVNIWLNYWAAFHDPETGLELATIKQNSNRSEITNHESFAARLTLDEAFWAAGAMWLCVLVLASFFTSLFYRMILRAARRIHTRLISSLLWTRMQFFDRTPQGQVINRISGDISHLDNAHLIQLEEMVFSFNSASFTFVSILLSVPNMSLGIGLVIVLVYLLFKYLAELTEVVKYLDGHRRAVLYSHVATTLAGLEVLRAARKQQMFLASFERLQDKHSSARFLNISLRRFVIGSLDWILMLFYVLLVWLDVIDTLNGQGLLAFVGLNLIVQLNRLCQTGFTKFVEFYTSAQALERIKEYSYLKSEQSLDGDYYSNQNNSNLASFTGGQVEFVGVSLKYDSSQKLVLRELSFRVEARERIGIVGRTGAGKSSLISVLFRLYHFEGFVYVDGQDTKQLEVESLRRSISIIPQEPALFSGTIRHNLDPFDQYRDEQLWQALEAVQLKERILHQNEKSASNYGLNMEVSESGANFSVGQRQLICLARAILRNNKLLVLDEATANVDQETDQLIQRAIRERFPRCTVFTVAHRLNTIIDSHRVMVIEDGQLREFASPRELIQPRAGGGGRSLFRQMIDSTGERQSKILLDKIESNNSS